MLDALGDRMKNYENINRVYLTRRMPCILRLDGRAFHTYTKKFNKPFDYVFMEAMWDTAKQLCQNISGAKMAYVQSDEISILLTDYDTLETEPWFGKNLQKMCSVAASMASIFFYKAHDNAIEDYIVTCEENDYIIPDWIDAHNNAQESKLAVFDCRAFVLPMSEVNNYFLWRQKDCERNAVSMVARTLFSDKELEGKSTEERKKMMVDQHSLDWEFILPFYRKGVCVRKYDCTETCRILGEEPFKVQRKRWEIAKHIPSFQEHPEYINELVNI